MNGPAVLEHVADSPLLRLAATRLAAALPVLLGVTLLTFVIVSVLPGNAARQLAGAEASAAQVAHLEAELGLDRPAWARYSKWLREALTGNFGRSLASGRPVAELVAERMPVTLELTALALAVSIGLAVPTALIAVRQPNGLFDRATLTLSMTGLSTASYVLALALVLVFSVRLAWLPAIGYAPPVAGLTKHLQSLTLPATAIAVPLFAFYTRFLRGELLEQLYVEEYIVAARARGIGTWRLLLRHALPNSVFGLLTLIAISIGSLVGGTVIVEQIFALPGVGRLLLLALATRDVPVVQAVVLLLTVMTVLANLVVDVLYTVLDPRVRHGSR